MTWPYPGDSPLAQARRVAHAYRAELADANHAACARLDNLMHQWGQTWAIPETITYNPDDWLTPHQAANLAGIKPDTLRLLRKRGRLKGRPKGRTYEYQARDIIALTATRTRKQNQEP